MRRIGLALAIAAAAAGCSSFPGASTASKEPAKFDIAANQKGFEDATTLFANKRYDQAARLCESVIQVRPYYAPAHLLLARSHHAAGKDDSAIPRYRGLLNLAPNHVEGLTELAAIYRSRNENDQALTLLERAYAQTEGREDIAAALAECRSELGVEVVEEEPPAEAPIEQVSAPAEPEGREEAPTPPVEEPAPPVEAAPVPPPTEEPTPAEAQPPRTEQGPSTPVAEGARPPKAVEVKPPAPKASEPRPPAPKPEPPAPKKPAPPDPPKAREAAAEEAPVRLSPEAQQWIEEGDRSLAEGLAADALEAYKKSREHGGPEAMLTSRVERATSAREEAQRTAKSLTSTLHTAEDPTDHRLRLAAAYLQDGRYLEAQLLLLQLSVLSPECGEAFYLLGIAYERRSEWRQAADAFTKARKLCAGTALDVQAGFHLEDIGAHLDH